MFKNIEDTKFEENFNAAMFDLKNYINERKSMISENVKEEKTFYSSKILSDKPNSPSSNNTKILHKYYKLCNIIEKMKNKDDNNLNDQFKIIISEELEDSEMDIFLSKEKKNINKIKYYQNNANYILIEHMIIKEKSNREEEIYAMELVNYFTNIFKFKDEILDLSTKFRDNEFLYIPKFKGQDINHYFLLKSLEDVDLKEEQDIQTIKSDVFSQENDFRDNGFPEIKNFDKGMKEVISLIESHNWNNQFYWLRKSFEELKQDSWKNPNRLLIKKKHELFYDDSKKIYDGMKVDIKSLFACYESKKPGKTIKLKTFPETKIQNISIKMEKNNTKYDYGYRIMELYNFDLYRDDISQSMLIIIDSIDKILEDKLRNILSEKILNLLSVFYEEFIEKISKEEIPDISNIRILKIFQYLLYFLCKIYDNIYKDEKKQESDEINKKIRELKNIIEESSDNAIKNLESENNNYLKKKKEYEDYIEEEKERAKNEFSTKKNYHKDYLNFERNFENSKEYENYIQIISSLTRPKAENFEKNIKYIKVFEIAKQTVGDIDKKNFEELRPCSIDAFIFCLISSTISLNPSSDLVVCE